LLQLATIYAQILRIAHWPQDNGNWLIDPEAIHQGEAELGWLSMHRRFARSAYNCCLWIYSGSGGNSIYLSGDRPERHGRDVVPCPFPVGRNNMGRCSF
jgi:hypothetical protein